ncbi:MAG: TOBE domain-containing protein, partial [Alphaproteobacteria bacterium]|nr:TOBE domain-containing protein [Alphaproteobacteria bacterium]
FVAGFVGDNHRWLGKVDSVKGDGLRVAVDSEQFITARAANQASFNRGDRVQIFVRPEVIDIAPADGTAEGTNQFAGTLQNLLFNGANSRAMVKVAGESELVEVALPQTAHYGWLQQGVPVRLGFSDSAALAFAA